MAKTHPVLKVLRDAIKGLLYPSETDAGFEAFAWPGAAHSPAAADVLKHAGEATDTAVEETNAADFFRAVPKSLKGDYLAFAGAVIDNLSQVKVFKVGGAKRVAYLVGVTPDGKWAGVKTELVET